MEVNIAGPISLLSSTWSFHNYISRAVYRCMGSSCHYWLWLSEFGGVVLSCFTYSPSTVLTDISLIKPEGSFNP